MDEHESIKKRKHNCRERERHRNPSSRYLAKKKLATAWHTFFIIQYVKHMNRTCTYLIRIAYKLKS